MSEIPNTETMEYVGNGSYASVYKLSVRRVVKVFGSNFSKDDVEGLIEDEILGSKEERSLPVLRVIDIFHNGRITKGLVKRLLKRNASWDEIEASGIDEDGFDVSPINCMVDTKGNVFKVDTMTEEGHNKYYRKRYKE